MDNMTAEKKLSDLEKLEQKVKEGLSLRGQEWVSFAVEVLLHIENYTVPQYGDKGEDNLTNWLPGDCMRQTGKYAARHGRNSREQQDLLDILKSAHYSQVAFTKLTEGGRDKQVARRTALPSMLTLQALSSVYFEKEREGAEITNADFSVAVQSKATEIDTAVRNGSSCCLIREIAILTALLLYFCESRGIDLNDMVEGVLRN